MFHAISRGQAASSTLCAENNIQLEVVDVGIDGDVSPPGAALSPGVSTPSPDITVTHAKVARGTANFTVGPAMTEAQLEAALKVGADAVARACERLAVAEGSAKDSSTVGARSGAEASAGNLDGRKAATAALAGGNDDLAACKPNGQQPPAGSAGSAAAAVAGEGGDVPPAWRWLALGVGELGIGNTTAAAAVAAALTGAPVDKVVGRGTGVDDAGLEIKSRAVAAALAANEGVMRDEGALGVVRAVGGLELAAMAGEGSGGEGWGRLRRPGGWGGCARGLVVVVVDGGGGGGVGGNPQRLMSCGYCSNMWTLRLNGRSVMCRIEPWLLLDCSFAG